ncbi:UvrABC system protein A [Anatilimnocola aggregata]|uniref:UvrABC system protein A n=1 Tax=Anatilimnocola aggregata TaxID=2528021 RepID=A0A517YKW1_9BACT|nr:excinuclease ABC subunit UvrA [Anatilimnocola aggregata]QDU30862.1 UvrABC system protein A [Anatilimnocola aggregata]
MERGQIELRGVEVHNLKHIDLDLPRGKLIVFCGASGSGKTSLALDTLYAEGQRRFIESFSTYTRQFLQRLEKPAAERIDGIPAAIAVTRDEGSKSNRTTIGSVTETIDYLRLLMARIGRLTCPSCGQPIERESPQEAAAVISELPAGAKLLIVAPLALTPEQAAAGPQQLLTEMRERGFARAIVDGQTLQLDQPATWPKQSAGTIRLVIDRLVAGQSAPRRVVDSLETAFKQAQGHCEVWWQADDANSFTRSSITEQLDQQAWRVWSFVSELRCPRCQVTYPQPEPRHFSFNNALGACPTCEGFGNLVDLDFELIVPDPSKSIREGAIAPWNTPAYEHELQELLALSSDYQIPIDVPFGELLPKHVELIREGVPERNFGGLKGFFAWLEKRKYKMHLRVYLNRWRSTRDCPSCHGARLNPLALAWKINGLNLAELSALRLDAAQRLFQDLPLTPRDRQVSRTMLEQVRGRLQFLVKVGLGYLSLDRTLRTLSSGESQRVALTSALGSSLVNMLYVLDEPSVGLHPRDVEPLVQAIRALQQRGNTVVVVEHEEAMIRAGDWIVEIGPGAGELGGRVTFQGTLPELLNAQGSTTGDFMAGRRGVSRPAQRRAPRGSLRLLGARGNNLKNLKVDFPLGVLCLVTGVSGAGKSTLVQDTLYGALCRRKKKDCDKPLPYDDVIGDGQIDDVVLVDQSPIGRSPRSNPVTYIKAFDEIRKVFAETVEARTHNYTAGHFSFNVDGGRCDACQGEGYIQVEMQFLADVFMKCTQCHGTRYRREILAVTYRGRNIADVLDMTVREAFSFFRGQAKVQGKLKQLIDVGLDYLRLGQPANTLSAGESQRLKLAAHLSEATRSRTLFLLDEPTTGLHFADIVQLLDCFDALLAIGHSLIVVEHNLQLMRSADYIIDVGPGAADEGGTIVVQGTPEEVAAHPDSITGQYLKEALEAVETAIAEATAAEANTNE